MISEFDRGWLIGVLEGEASFGFYGSTQRVAVEMTDEDTVIKIAKLLGQIAGETLVISTFDRSHKVNRENSSGMFRVQITGKKARRIMADIVPYMSKRRRAKIWQSLNGFQAPKLSSADILRLVSK